MVGVVNGQILIWFKRVIALVKFLKVVFSL